MTELPPPFVRMVAPGKWVLSGAAPLRSALTGLPAAVRRRGADITLEAFGKDDATAARIAEHLRDLGVAFSAGRDWSPAALIGSLKDRGMAVGSFTEIVWSAAGQWSLRPIE